jgi:hypothetical protein
MGAPAVRSVRTVNRVARYSKRVSEVRIHSSRWGYTVRYVNGCAIDFVREDEPRRWDDLDEDYT